LGGGCQERERFVRQERGGSSNEKDIKKKGSTFDYDDGAKRRRGGEVASTTQRRRMKGRGIRGICRGAGTNYSEREVDGGLSRERISRRGASSRETRRKKKTTRRRSAKRKALGFENKPRSKKAGGPQPWSNPIP